MTSTSRKATPFKRAVAFFGNQSALAVALGVSRQAVSVYDRRGWFPFNRAKVIARRMKIDPHELMLPWKPKYGTKAPNIRMTGKRTKVVLR